MNHTTNDCTQLVSLKLEFHYQLFIAAAVAESRESRGRDYTTGGQQPATNPTSREPQWEENEEHLGQEAREKEATDRQTGPESSGREDDNDRKQTPWKRRERKRRIRKNKIVVLCLNFLSPQALPKDTSHAEATPSTTSSIHEEEADMEESRSSGAMASSTSTDASLFSIDVSSIAQATPSIASLTVEDTASRTEIDTASLPNTETFAMEKGDSETMSTAKSLHGELLQAGPGRTS
ncbi:unnamed protein product [Boreogadus saida]